MASFGGVADERLRPNLLLMFGLGDEKKEDFREVPGEGTLDGEVEADNVSSLVDKYFLTPFILQAKRGQLAGLLQGLDVVAVQVEPVG